MKTACPCLAGAAALALALVVANVPAPATAAPEDKTPKRNLDSPYANTAIGAVLDANDGEIPVTGAVLVQALRSLGKVVALPVSFSAVALDSGLTHPRVVITLRPSTLPEDEFIGGGGGWGGPPIPPQKVTKPPDPLNKIAPNRAQLQGRLFLAANTELTPDGLKVRTVEFISWNSRKLRFDFGVIERMNTKDPELKILDGTRCFTCHKNKGPILGAAPWSNTMHNEVVRNTAVAAMSRPAKLPDGTEVRVGNNTDGLSLLGPPRAMEVDAAVRLGAAIPRDRAMFKRLAETPETRKALALLFDAILQLEPPDKNPKPDAPKKDPKPEFLEKIDTSIKGNLDSLIPARLARDARSTQLNGAPSILRDFSPAGPVTREFRTWQGPNGAKNQVTLYDEDRAKGRPRLPSEFQPSNPKAFAEPQVKPGQQPSDFMNATLLAQTMGLSEGDRAFLANVLDDAVKRLNNPALTRDAVSNMIFTGPAFADVLATGNIPDRDDFKDRFVAGILDVFKSQKRNDTFWRERDTYASTPKFDPNAKEEKEVAVLPSHACLACHDTPSSRKTFNPIPQLAFDPFDATARAEWLKATDRKRKVEVLGRMVKRLGTDKDMPPEDSAEHELYRVKDPAALNAVVKWLETELKRVK